MGLLNPLLCACFIIVHMLANSISCDSQPFELLLAIHIGIILRMKILLHVKQKLGRNAIGNICDCLSENQHSLHFRFWSFNDL